MPRKPIFSEATIALKARETRIVVVADTHSRPHKNAHQLIAEKKPHYILHAGDIGELSVLDRLEEIAPLITVRGNIDEIRHDLPDYVTINLDKSGQTQARWLMTHIAVYGPKLRGPVRKIAQQKKANMVVCGHSHVPLMVRDRDMIVFNPGSIGPRRFTLPILFGVIYVSSKGIRLEHFDCETGEAWKPPVLPN